MPTMSAVDPMDAKGGINHVGKVSVNTQRGGPSRKTRTPHTEQTNLHKVIY